MILRTSAQPKYTASLIVMVAATAGSLTHGPAVAQDEGPYDKINAETAKADVTAFQRFGKKELGRRDSCE